MTGAAATNGTHWNFITVLREAVEASRSSTQKHAFALGGEANTENIHLLCRAHNALEAERVFGAEHMDRTRGNLDPRPDQGRLPGVQSRPTLRVRDGGAFRARLSARW